MTSSLSRLRWVGLLAVVAAASTCINVEPFALGVCGNGVLEPARGEDCDTATVGEGTVCQPPGATNACRYTCIDAVGALNDCPKGWGCGRDGICRQHASTVQRTERRGIRPGTIVDLADFDGDGFDDISWLFDSRFEVTHDIATSSAVTRSVEAFGIPTVDDANGDGRADWLVPTFDGLRVFRGASDREPRPTLFQSIPLTFDVLEFIPIDLIPDVIVVDGQPFSFGGDESLLVRPGPDGIASFGGDTLIGDDIDDTDVLLASAVVAEFDTTRDPMLIPPGAATPNELVIGRTDRNEVVLYRPELSAEAFTGPNGVDVSVTVSFTTDMITTITLDGTPARLWGAHHLNPPLNGTDSALPCGGGTLAPGDEHFDLIIEASNDVEGGNNRYYAAYGLGDGTFHSDACALSDVPLMVPADNRAAPMPRFDLCSQVRDFGHLDDDGAIDVVTSLGVWTTALVGGAQVASACDADVPFVPTGGFGDWRFAFIDDFNGDGHNDVLAATAGSGLDFLAGSGGPALTPLHFGSGSNPTQMAVGDFDANGIPDAVIAERGVDGLDRVFAVFGELLGPPTEPLEIGSLEGLYLLKAFDVGGAFPDEASDLVIGFLPDADDPDQRPFVGLVDGTPDRQLFSSFVQAYDFSNVEFYAPVSTAFGAFVAPGERHVAMLAVSIPSLDDPTLPPWGLGLAGIRGDLGFPLIGEEPTVVDLGPFFTRDQIASIPVDIDQDGRDELFIMSSGFDDTGVASLRTFVGQFDEAGAFTGGAPFIQPQLSSFGADVNTMVAFDDVVDPILHRPLRCDLDATGAPSVVIGVLEREVCTTGPRAEALVAAVYVLPPAMLRALQRGEDAAFAPEWRIQTDGERSIVGFTCFNGDGDAADEIALLTLDVPAPSCTADPPTDARERKLTGAVDMIDVVDGKLTSPTTLVTLTEEDASSLEVETEVMGTPLDNFPPPLAGFAAGDIDGDGVDDFVIGARDITLLIRGQAVNP